MFYQSDPRLAPINELEPKHLQPTSQIPTIRGHPFESTESLLVGSREETDIQRGKFRSRTGQIEGRAGLRSG